MMWFVIVIVWLAAIANGLFLFKINQDLNRPRITRNDTEIMARITWMAYLIRRSPNYPAEIHRDFSYFAFLSAVPNEDRAQYSKFLETIAADVVAESQKRAQNESAYKHSSWNRDRYPNR